MSHKKPLNSRYYDSALASAGNNTELEIVHWFNEPTDWITEEHTGANAKEYIKNFQASRTKYEETLRMIETQLAEEVNYNTFKWTINSLKDDVRIMRAVVNRAAADLAGEKSAKHCGVPVEKFYSRILRLITFITFVIGLISGIYDLVSSGAPEWLSITLFSIATAIGAASSQVADRWALRERRRRKLQRVVDQRDQIKTAKAFIDALDFDEEIIIAINRQRLEIGERYRDKPKKAKKALEKLGRAVDRKDRRQLPRLVSQITPMIIEEHVHNKRRLQHQLASEDLEDTVIFFENE